VTGEPDDGWAYVWLGLFLVGAIFVTVMLW
jgi:hypothetical protein